MRLKYIRFAVKTEENHFRATYSTSGSSRKLLGRNRTMAFCPQPDNISVIELVAISSLKCNNKINLKKAVKGTTTVVLDTA